MPTWSHQQQLEALTKIEDGLAVAFPDLPRTSAKFRNMADFELTKIGVDPYELRSRIEREKESAKQARVQKIRAAASSFMSAHPETDPVNGFVPGPENEDIMFGHMAEQGMDATEVHHYELAFAAVRN